MSIAAFTVFYSHPRAGNKFRFDIGKENKL